MPAPPKQFVFAFIATAALLIIPAVLFSLYLGPVTGDLVRIGHFAARDFAPTKRQEPLQRIAAPREGEPTDIVVLGDSFSTPNSWQSELTRLTGQRVATWRFRDVGCTRDWIRKAVGGSLRSGARAVVVVTVERSFRERFADRPSCEKNIYPPFEMPVGVVGEPPHWSKIFPLDIGHLSKSVLQYRRTRGATGRFQGYRVVAVDLVRGDLFTNTQSARFLYYIDDEIKIQGWSEVEADAVLARYAAWQRWAAASGVALRLVVIPDKSSVYWPHIRHDQRLPYPERGERLFALIGERLGEKSNLLPLLRDAAVLRTDLYNPDDTHLSVDGQRVLAKRMAELIATGEEISE